jgi:F420H(2)-dependent quinone reductase
MERRSGLFYIEDGPAFVVVASNAGEDRDPSWWRNLQAHPDAEVEIGRRTLPVRARAATADEEARLWPRLDEGYPEYARYRAKVSRHMLVVILEPRGEPHQGDRR